EKNIPVAAGLGGGSADAAAALRLIARLNGLAFGDPDLRAAALAVGADVPVCVDSRTRIMRGGGELLAAPIELPALPAVLVNPRVPLSTREVFGKFSGPRDANGLADVPQNFTGLIEFLKQHDNDLTPAATACTPLVGAMLGALEALSGVKLARMSGSGPPCFALFASQSEAATAARMLADRHRDWWIQSATIGSTSA